jgi:hypothetical protein
MQSFPSKCDWIIIINPRVKARLYVKLTIMFDRNESPRETKRCYSLFQNAIYAVDMNKVPYVLIPIKSDWIIFIRRHVKPRLNIYIVHN